MGVGLAMYWVRTTPPKYNVNASLKVNRQFDFPTYGLENRMPGLKLFSGLANIYTYIGEVNSRSVLLNSIYDCGYDVQYFRGDRETVKQLPFTVELDRSHRQLVEQDFKIEALENGDYHITTYSSDVFIFDYSVIDHDRKNGIHFALDTVLAPGEWYAHDWARFRVVPTGAENTKEVKRIRFPNPTALVARYMQQLRVKTLNKGASVITIAITTNQRHKDMALVNAIMTRYAAADLLGKEGLARNTKGFLDMRLDTTLAELALVEDKLKTFKENRGWLDLTKRTEQILDEESRLRNTLANADAKLTYLEHVQVQARRRLSLDTIFAPSMAGINDKALISLINQSAALDREIAEKKIFAGPRNPGMLRAKAQQDMVRDHIEAFVDAVVLKARHDRDFTARELRSQVASAQALPQDEREWLHLQRRRDRALATAKRLRKKSNQVASALAANIPDVELLEAAFVKGNKPVAPIAGLAYAILGFIGFFIPVFGVMTSRMASPSISTEEELTELCDYPVVMYHPLITSKKARLWTPGPSAHREAFCQMAEDYLSRAGTGKTFTAWNGAGKKTGTSTVLANLAMALGAQGRTVVVLTQQSSVFDVDLEQADLMQWVAGGCSGPLGLDWRGARLVQLPSQAMLLDWSEMLPYLHQAADDILVDFTGHLIGASRPLNAEVSALFHVVYPGRTSPGALEALTGIDASATKYLAFNGVSSPNWMFSRNKVKAYFPVQRSTPERLLLKIWRKLRRKRLLRRWA